MNSFIRKVVGLNLCWDIGYPEGFCGFPQCLQTNIGMPRKPSFRTADNLAENQIVYLRIDRLCGLVVRVLDYRSGGPGSIPGTTRFSGRGKKKKEENK
jgi:hypothetical protein